MYKIENKLKSSDYNLISQYLNDRVYFIEKFDTILLPVFCADTDHNKLEGTIEGFNYFIKDLTDMPDIEYSNNKRYLFAVCHAKVLIMFYSYYLIQFAEQTDDSWFYGYDYCKGNYMLAEYCGYPSLEAVLNAI
jgi:hypothetical protein